MKIALSLSGLIALGLLLGLCLAGCASPIRWQRPGATVQDMERDKAACRMRARELPPVTGQSTQAGNALVSMGAFEGQYEDCMVASGWTADNL